MRRHGRNALRRRLCQRDPPARENAAGPQPIDLIFGPAVFDRDVLALDQAALFQALAIGAQAFAEPVRRCASATGRGLPQRTEKTAHHDRIHHSKKTERNSALSVHAWVTPCSSSAMKPTPAPNKSNDVSNPIQTRTAGRRRLGLVAQVSGNRREGRSCRVVANSAHMLSTAFNSRSLSTRPSRRPH